MDGSRSTHGRRARISSGTWLITAALVAAAALYQGCSWTSSDEPIGDRREEVVFWHFWGGRDRLVVDDIVDKFNASQDAYRVRAVAMPGTNLDLKFFLSVAGGDPPDLLNHDDPVVADWAHRGVLTPLAEIASAEETEQLRTWLFPAAAALGAYEDRLYALCNGLDIRALYCNKTLLDEFGLPIPEKLEDLDRIAATIAPPSKSGQYDRMGYLPDPRRLWAWGAVFGGAFFQPSAASPQQQITADSAEIVRALEWMASYSRRYGPSVVAAFRSGEQAVTGAAFPLLQNRRYAAVMDGQWRVRDIAAAQRYAHDRGEPFDEFVVAPLPPPAGGRPNAGWVNGNFFVIPRTANCKQGAWAFAKFWTGLGGNESVAARACARGGWIPASPRVVDRPEYQEALGESPLLIPFVALAGSPNQAPTPPIPVASYYVQQVNQAAEHLLFRDPESDAAALLSAAANRVRARLQEALDER